ncbi:hypothetical protein GCM10027425_10060 [Alteromonas gracilis]
MSEHRLSDLLDRIHLSPGRDAAVIERVRLVSRDPETLRRELGSYVYSVMHAGQASGHEYVPFHHRDHDFESRLLAASPRPYRSTWLPLEEHDDESAHVRLGGVRIRVGRDRLDHVDPDRRTAQVRTVAARPLLSPGFVLVDGDRTSVETGGGLVRVYVHVAHAEHAVEVWRRALGTLEEQAVPYRIKILSSPQQYPRRDALVVYLSDPRAEDLTDLARSLSGLAGLGEAISPFAHALAPGVAIAHEPDDPRPGMRGLSFGQHRSRLLAEAVWEASVTGTDPLEELRRLCAAARVCPEEPAFNLSAPLPQLSTTAGERPTSTLETTGRR